MTLAHYREAGRPVLLSLGAAAQLWSTPRRKVALTSEPAIVDAQDVLTKQLLTCAWRKLLRAFLQLFDIVASMVGMGKIGGPEETIFAA